MTEDGCTAFGKVFHKECFRCHGCKKRLDGKFYSKDDNAYCAKCFKVMSNVGPHSLLILSYSYQNTQEQCCVCKQKIVGDCVVNNKTFYHPGCMKVALTSHLSVLSTNSHSTSFSAMFARSL